VSPSWIGDMSKIDKIGRHIFYKKRNEKPYEVDATAEETAQTASAEGSSALTLTPTLSLVSSMAGSATPPTQAMSLGYAPHE
jgi:hypothetical protein